METNGLKQFSRFPSKSAKILSYTKYFKFVQLLNSFQKSAKWCSSFLHLKIFGKSKHKVFFQTIWPRPRFYVRFVGAINFIVPEKWINAKVNWIPWFGSEIIQQYQVKISYSKYLIKVVYKLTVMKLALSVYRPHWLNILNSLFRLRIADMISLNLSIIRASLINL